MTKLVLLTAICLSVSSTAWAATLTCSGMPDGTPCAAGDPCTRGDTCIDEVCQPGLSSCADDGTQILVPDVCPAAPTPPSCEDSEREPSELVPSQENLSDARIRGSGCTMASAPSDGGGLALVLLIGLGLILARREGCR